MRDVRCAVQGRSAQEARVGRSDGMALLRGVGQWSKFTLKWRLGCATKHRLSRGYFLPAGEPRQAAIGQSGPWRMEKMSLKLKLTGGRSLKGGGNQRRRWWAVRIERRNSATTVV